MTIKTMENNNEVGKLASSPKEIQGIINKAVRKLADAEVDGLSNESRLEHAYTCILLCSTIALRASGYRVIDVVRFHYISVKTLRHTLNLSRVSVKYFQQLRNKRHTDIYTSRTTTTETEALTAVKSAKKVLNDTRKWVETNYPELLIN